MSCASTLLRCCAAAITAATLPGLALACTPPSPKEASGFFRHHVQRLPHNAHGVMFSAPAGGVRAQDFSVTSDLDRRPLALRLRTVGDAWVRIEPLNGMVAGASYRFRYLKPHAEWAYPDQMTVSVDQASAATDGQYRIVLDRQPKHRVIAAPTSDGSCVAPAPAVVQEFSYAVPAPLLRYRDVLDYDASLTALPRVRGQFASYSLEWPIDRPVVYDSQGYSLGQSADVERYNARQNAVVAVCGTRQPQITLQGTVWFPELDLRVFHTPAVKFNLRRNVDGPCTDLDTLIRTVNWTLPEPDLRAVCIGRIPSSIGTSGEALRAIQLEDWERSFHFLYDLAPTCNLVALAHLWRTGQFSAHPETLRRIGTAIELGMSRAEGTQRNAVIHALSYLADQLPAARRPVTARHLLAPLQTALTQELMLREPVRPEHIGKLLRMSGPLSTANRAQLGERAKGSGEAAAQARLLVRTGT